MRKNENMPRDKYPRIERERRFLLAQFPSNATGCIAFRNGIFTGLAEYREVHWQFRNAHCACARFITPSLNESWFGYESQA